MPRAFTPYERELIGKRLREAGYRLFSAYGLRKTNIEEIARAAGISKGAFYLFYGSKEELFMDAAEMAEAQFRQEILSAIGQRGPSPRARLFALLQKAFRLVKTIPLLQFVSGSDFDLLLRRIPPEKLQEHIDNDRAFFDEFIVRCRSEGIQIKVPSAQIARLLYPLAVTLLHEEDPSRNQFGGGIDPLLELIAAYCVGEVKTRLQGSARPSRGPRQRASR